MDQVVRPLCHFACPMFMFIVFSRDHERNNVTAPATIDKHSNLGCSISSGCPGTSSKCKLLIRPQSRRFSVKVRLLQFTLTIKL